MFVLRAHDLADSKDWNSHSVLSFFFFGMRVWKTAAMVLVTHTTNERDITYKDTKHKTGENNT